jgi:CheY-like chemotaxis protein
MFKEETNKVRVVLVDDDIDDSYIFNTAVQQSNLPIELSIAEDGQKLFNYLAANPLPDIIFLDINMPFKNGIECLGEIRANNKYSDIPVVMYSTTSNRLNVDACFDAGANLFVVKPNTFEEVDRMVQQICRKEWTLQAKAPSKEEFIMQTF